MILSRQFHHLAGEGAIRGTLFCSSACLRGSGLSFLLTRQKTLDAPSKICPIWTIPPGKNNEPPASDGKCRGGSRLVSKLIADVCRSVSSVLRKYAALFDVSFDEYFTGNVAFVSRSGNRSRKRRSFGHFAVVERTDPDVAQGIGRHFLKC